MKVKDIITRLSLLLTAIVLSAVVKAQDPCTITCNAEMPVCSETPVTLSVIDTSLYAYHWMPGNETTSSITVRPFETTTYRVEITNVNTEETICSSEFTVEVKPRFQIHFQQIQLTCSNADEDNGKTAQMLAYAEEGALPYTYEWEVGPLHIAPGCDSLAIGLEAYKYYAVNVTDGRGCTQRDSTLTKAYPNPIVEITAEPGDTVYMQNPHVTFSFENKSIDSISISNFYWVLNAQYGLTSDQEEPLFTFVDVGDYNTELKVYNPQGCDTSYFKTIKVNPVKLKVPNIFTPNGDGMNDYFIISLDDTGGNGGGSDNGGNGTGNRNDEEPEMGHEYDAYEPLNRYYESTELVIFNRWGRIVYQSNDYHNDWDGGDLPDATYFYVLKCHGLKQDANYQGSVMIFRGN